MQKDTVIINCMECGDRYPKEVPAYLATEGEVAGYCDTCKQDEEAL